MVLELLKSVFGRRLRLPRDQVTRPSRAARKAAEPQVAAMQAAIDEIAALPGIADVALIKRLPKGFTAAVHKLAAAYDAYIDVIVQHTPALQRAVRPGTPDGHRCCYEHPIGVTATEGTVIYRAVRPWRDFPAVAQELARTGEQQFKDIQALHTGKDPDRISMTGAAVQEGRLQFARRRELCPLLDRQSQRCRVWSERPFSCRMHFALTDPAWSDPQDPHYPKQVKAFNVRLPLRQQVALMQIEKRMVLQAAPFLGANILQWLQLCEGQQFLEVGEAPPRFAADGLGAVKPTRSRASAKKYEKGKKKPRK